MSEIQPTTSTTATETKVYFGVALELAGKVIALEPKNAINELKEKGIEVELPPGERVYLGTVGQSLNSILQTLGAVEDGETASFLTEDGKLNEDELPDISALKTAANLVVDAGLYVDAFHVRIPGSAAPAGGTGPATKDKTAYTVGLSAEWVEDAGQLIEGLDLKLRGVYFKVSNQ
ncbi:MAG: hypothetical protein F6K00_20870 [Leptolyngbya sp. SIOISBB]|nr:hypothetical protein [Leptolyngbya sp. SIOISBB]